MSESTLSVIMTLGDLLSRYFATAYFKKWKMQVREVAEYVAAKKGAEDADVQVEVEVESAAVGNRQAAVPTTPGTTVARSACPCIKFFRQLFGMQIIRPLVALFQLVSRCFGNNPLFFLSFLVARFRGTLPGHACQNGKTNPFCSLQKKA